jgi:hypothetical protein
LKNTGNDQLAYALRKGSYQKSQGIEGETCNKDLLAASCITHLAKRQHKALGHDEIDDVEPAYY